MPTFVPIMLGLIHNLRWHRGSANIRVLSKLQVQTLRRPARFDGMVSCPMPGPRVHHHYTPMDFQRCHLSAAVVNFPSRAVENVTPCQVVGPVFPFEERRSVNAEQGGTDLVTPLSQGSDLVCKLV
jgi:hypothetical protein